jgi:predicted nucleic acid-binding protein
VSVFFDTNVLVYCSDPSDKVKRNIARDLVAIHRAANDAVISTQVLIELFNVLTRKQKLTAAQAKPLVLSYAQWPLVSSDLLLVTEAFEGSEKHQLSIWDSMIVCAAVRMGADVLYSEDLTHSQQFGRLTVVNPFV